MKPAIALVGLFISACAGSPDDSSTELTGPTGPITPPSGSDKVDGGEWGTRAPLLEPNSEFALAEASGRLYLLGGYPPGRVSVRTVQIYVAGGRLPRGNAFAVYDPATDRWETLPSLPTPRDHIAGAAIDGRIHVVGGRPTTAVHEVYDPQPRTWTKAAPMLRGRSGMNGVMARGCFHVWGGEDPSPAIGMYPDHDYYDPRTDRWTRLRDMPIPVHGVTGSAFVNGLIWVAGGDPDLGGNFGSLHHQVFRPTVSCE